MFTWVSLIAIVLAVLVNTVAGMLVYSPLMFGKQWMKLIGKTEEDVKGGAGMEYAGAMLSAAVTAFVLVILVELGGFVGVGDGVVLGFLVWLGFSVATAVPDYLFAGRSMKLLAINSLYNLISLVLMSAMIAGVL